MVTGKENVRFISLVRLHRLFKSLTFTVSKDLLCLLNLIKLNKFSLCLRLLPNFGFFLKANNHI